MSDAMDERKEIAESLLEGVAGFSSHFRLPLPNIISPKMFLPFSPVSLTETRTTATCIRSRTFS